MADTFRPQANGLFYDVINERTGEVVVELVDCIGDARWYCQDLAAADLESEQAALAEQEADYRVESDMLDAVYRAVARMFDCDLPETHPKNRAVQLSLDAIYAISKPVADDVREAA